MTEARMLGGVGDLLLGDLLTVGIHLPQPVDVHRDVTVLVEVDGPGRALEVDVLAREDRVDGVLELFERVLGPWRTRHGLQLSGDVSRLRGARRERREEGQVDAVERLGRELLELGPAAGLLVIEGLVGRERRARRAGALGAGHALHEGIRALAVGEGVRGMGARGIPGTGSLQRTARACPSRHRRR